MEATFRNVLDTVPTTFKAQAAQAIKAGFNNLNKKLKGKLGAQLLLRSY